MARHGTWLGYSSDGCHCQDCSRAWSVYSKQRRWRLHRRRASGDPILVPVERLMRFLNDRTERWGVTVYAICKAAGINHGTPYLIAGQEHVDSQTYNAIVSVTFDDLHDRTRCTARLAWEPADRIRQRTGWTWKQIAAEAGVPRGAIEPAGRKRRPGVSIATVRKLRALDDHLNSLCDECDTPALAGGRWCWTHYRQHANPRPPARARGHGSPARYQKHLRDGDDPCEACRDANSRAYRSRTA